jgi:hypothetical protein
VNRPEPGKTYALTGDGTTPSISNGNTWAESEVRGDELHHADGTHRTTAASANGTVVARFEQRIREHLAKHERRS